MSNSLLPERLVGQFFGVGSLGEKDPETPIEYIKKLPIPYAFQVTYLHEEDMIRQFGYLIDGFEEEGDFLIDIDLHEYRSITESSDGFLPDMNHAHSFYLLIDGTAYQYFKTQQTAPITMCYSTRARDGKQHLTRTMFHLYVSLMKRIAKGQIEHMQSSCENIILCQDDPALGLVLEKMGRDEVPDLTLKDIVKTTDTIYPKEVIPAYHYCDDWRKLDIDGVHTLWDAPAKIAHIDLVNYPPIIEIEQAEKLNRFLETGGALALGVLPNVDDSYSESVASTLERNLMNAINSFQQSGVSIELLNRNSLVSTQCGLSRASIKLTREIHETLLGSRKIFERVMENAGAS